MSAEQHPRREVVTGVPRGARRAPGHAPARSEIDEQTTLGDTYVRSLMRSQLRAALAAFAGLALLVGPLPLLFARPPPATALPSLRLGGPRLRPSTRRGAARPLVRTPGRAQRTGLRQARRRTADRARGTGP